MRLVYELDGEMIPIKQIIWNIITAIFGRVLLVSHPSIIADAVSVMLSIKFESCKDTNSIPDVRGSGASDGIEQACVIPLS